MKILFTYGGSYVFGKERYALNLMRGLQAAGHALFNVANGWNDGHFIQLLEESGIPHTTIKLGKISKSLAPKHLKWTLDALAHLPLALWKFRNQIKKFNPDVVVLDNCYNYYFLGKFCRGKKILIEYHEEPKRNYWLDQMLKSTAAKSIAHIGVSNFICNRLIEHGISPNSVFLVRNSYQELPNQSSTPLQAGDEINLGFAGQISAQKGIEYLLKALGIIKNDIPFHCWIVGTGDRAYLNFLKKKCVHLGIDSQITWLGYLKDMDVFYRKIQLCIVPSTVNESFGRIPMEAGLYAVPSIVTNRGGLPEIVSDSQTGYLVPSHSPEAIAEKIAAFYKQPGSLQEMGIQASADYGKRFSRDRQVSAFTQVIHQIAPA